jgi:predicted ABC-type ATPase
MSCVDYAQLLKTLCLTIVAGPNGSGKTSVIRRVEFAGRANLLEADAIASRICAAAPMRAAIPAGRGVLRRAQQFLDSCEDFAIETTLSGNWTRRVIRRALARHLFVP